MSAYPDACFITSAHRPEQFVRDEGAEIAVAGRSNAGKSSAINAIVNRKSFAHTSKSPGRTQLINFFSLGDRRRLVDLPGYGYARVARSLREHWRDLLEAYFKDRASLTGLILVVDSRRLLRDFDWQMLDWCRVIGCPVHVLLTKADKLKKAAASNALLSVRREVPENVSVQLFSALKGQGVEQARRRLDELLRGCGSQEAKKEASGAEYRGAPEAKSTGLG